MSQSHQLLAPMSEQSGPSARLHVQPHGAHFDKTVSALEDIEEDEHDYESLPIGYGWGTNMIAGAMVSSVVSSEAGGWKWKWNWHWCGQWRGAMPSGRAPPFSPASTYPLPHVYGSANIQAGISEHAAIFPVDSIKVSQSRWCGRSFVFLAGDGQGLPGRHSASSDMASPGRGSHRPFRLSGRFPTLLEKYKQQFNRKLTADAYAGVAAAAGRRPNCTSRVGSCDDGDSRAHDDVFPAPPQRTPRRGHQVAVARCGQCCARRRPSARSPLWHVRVCARDCRRTRRRLEGCSRHRRGRRQCDHYQRRAHEPV